MALTITGTLYSYGINGLAALSGVNGQQQFEPLGDPENKYDHVYTYKKSNSNAVASFNGICVCVINMYICLTVLYVSAVSNLAQ